MFGLGCTCRKEGKMKIPTAPRGGYFINWDFQSCQYHNGFFLNPTTTSSGVLATNKTIIYLKRLL